MEDESKSYPLPTQSLPTLKLSDHLTDLLEVRDFVESRGIQTKNTRIERYIQYLKAVDNEGLKDGSLIFKNSAGGPFENVIDWLLYVLREVHELMWILKGLKMHAPAGLDGKLKIVVSGSDFAVLDTNNLSRNIQFELRIASYFCQAGCEVDLTDTDVVALTKGYKFYVECKRIGSMKQLQGRLEDAARQLHRRIPRNRDKRIAYGCIAADVTKAAFIHNGLTRGLTNDHSREVIQKKLISIALTTDKGQVFRNYRNILLCWLQIHIPSLITYPLTPITRFSSYFFYNPKLDKEAWTAYKVFHDIPRIADKGDEREIPPRALTLRKSLDIPVGTTFRLDDDLLHEFLESGQVTGKKQEELIAELTLNDLKHEFTFSDLELAITHISKSQRRRMAKNVNHARLELVIEMYRWRYPYENSETGGQNLSGQTT